MSAPAQVDRRTVAGISMTVARFDSVADWARYARAATSDVVRHYFSVHGDSSWMGDTRDGATAKAVSGDTSRVRDAERLLEHLQVEVPTPHSEWVPARAGAFPVVPEALAGFPEPMRRKVWTPSDRTPLRLYVDTGCSAGISVAQATNRGVACLALALALSAERPVELWAFAAGTQGMTPGAACAARIPTGPMDLAAACHALTATSMFRVVGMPANCELSGNRLIHDWFGHGGRSKYIGHVRELFDLLADDLIVPWSNLGDEAIQDPVGFVKRSLAEHLGKEQE